VVLPQPSRPSNTMSRPRFTGPPCTSGHPGARALARRSCRSPSLRRNFDSRAPRGAGTSLALAVCRALGHTRHAPLTGPGDGGKRGAGREHGFDVGHIRGEARVEAPARRLNLTSLAFGSLRGGRGRPPCKTRLAAASGARSEPKASEVHKDQTERFTESCPGAGRRSRARRSRSIRSAPCRE